MEMINFETHEKTVQPIILLVTPFNDVGFVSFTIENQKNIGIIKAMLPTLKQKISIILND